MNWEVNTAEPTDKERIEQLERLLNDLSNKIVTLYVRVGQFETEPDPQARGLDLQGGLRADIVEAADLQARTMRVSAGDPSVALLAVTDRVEVGTADPDKPLTVHGHVVLDANGTPRLYGGTGTQELNGHLDLLNSPELRSAMGLKAGGLLVSDTYAFANPGKNDLIVKGNVGIGIAAPAQKLHVNGNLQVDGAVTGKALSVGGNVQISGAVSNKKIVALQIQTPTGRVDVGPMNANWCHFQTDRNKYYFDHEIRVDSGKIGSYDEDLQFCVKGTPKATLREDGGLQVSGTGIDVRNPDDERAGIGLDFNDNVPRLRIGGDGKNADNEFQIQGVGNKVRLRVDKNGNLWVIGDLHIGGELFVKDQVVRYHGVAVQGQFGPEPRHVAVWGPVAKG